MTNYEEMNKSLSFRAKPRNPVGETSQAAPRDPSTALRFAQDDLASVIRPSSFIRHSSFVIRHFP